MLIDSWTTFLKARLVCGHPRDPKRFHRLRDAFLLKEGRTLYGVFSNTWGKTAVCKYSMNEISSAFKTSKLRGYTGSLSGSRPGMCVASSAQTPKTTLTIIKDHPEIETVIYPEGQRPLYLLENNETYTQVVADRVRDASNTTRMSSSLEQEKFPQNQGKIHKVLQKGEQTVIIAELSPFKKEAPVSSMVLDTTMGHLYVSTEFEVARLSLADCDQYKDTCWNCVLARDPYCGWNPSGLACSAVSQVGNYSGRYAREADNNNTYYESHSLKTNAANIVPAFPSQTAVTIAVDGNLYSALSGSKSTIQRSYGNKKLIKTEDNWLTRVEFVSAALLAERNQVNDEIYFFYNEVNQSAGLDDEPYKAQLGRVCKADDGGKNMLIDSWTTFLKARLVCGHPRDPKRFHRLRDAFLLKEGRTLYGVFSNTWGKTAVCKYSMNEISSAFKTSKLRGYTGSLSGSRPGMCVASSAQTPKTTLTIIKDHPEIETVIYPEGQRPLYLLENNETYTQVVADRVRDASNTTRDVLFLGTDQGKIHKVLQKGEQTVIIAELSPFKKEAPVSSMVLDTTMGHLYVSTEFEVARLSLADCDQYKDTCWNCVLARDPYCGWNPSGLACSAVSQAGNYSGSLLQSLDPQSTDVCKGVEEQKSQEALKKVSVDPTGYIYLPCPMRSHHATYTWVKDDSTTYSCSMDGESCTLRFGEATPMDKGVFKCTSKEEGYREEITAYEVTLNVGWIPKVSSVLVATGVLFLAVTILLL
ncbi:semaphorin-7A-like [Heteronotia binoei]|uniref:semaphorin-7A-like n=1 Tax=Heteronotia binoei TaxID=13085 RepID=UPI002931610F|nr:semaphorin-7A-like [Heteronotia binoei]